MEANVKILDGLRTRFRIWREARVSAIRELIADSEDTVKRCYEEIQLPSYSTEQSRERNYGVAGRHIERIRRLKRWLRFYGATA